MMGSVFEIGLARAAALTRSLTERLGQHGVFRRRTHPDFPHAWRLNRRHRFLAQEKRRLR
jgi:hypothetical protein